VRWLGLAPGRHRRPGARWRWPASRCPGIPWSRSSVGFAALAASLAGDEGELGEWLARHLGFAKQVLPLLLGGVLVAGLLLGRPATRDSSRTAWVADSVGWQRVGANLFAAVAGAFMLLRHPDRGADPPGAARSDGPGPGARAAARRSGALAAAMLVLRSLMGGRKTIVYVSLVVVMSTITGLLYGWLAGLRRRP